MSMVVNGTSGLTYPDSTTESSASIGYGQTWATYSRTSGTTYTNSTGRPIFVFVGLNATSGGQGYSIVINGVTIGSGSVYSNSITASFIVPPSATYQVNFGGSFGYWSECR